MFSSSHFSNFLSDPIRKQSAMSKRGQTATSSEGSPMVKPKPMIPAKARPINSPRSARENPPQDLGYPVNRENVDAGQGDHTSTKKLVRAVNTRTEFHQFLTKVFQSLQKKSGITTGYSTCAMEAIKTFCVDMENVHVFVNESSHSSWTELFGELGGSQRTRTSRKFRVYSISHRLWYWSSLTKFWMCIRLKVHLTIGRDRHWLMIKWSSGQKQKYVSTQTPYCVWWRCRFTTKQLQDGLGQVEEFKMSASHRELLGSRMRTHWIRVEYSPRIYVIGDSSENPEWCARAEHWGKMGLHSHSNGDSKIPVIQNSRVSLLWVVEFWKRRTTETPYTSMRMLQTQSPCSESFILSIYGAVSIWCERVGLTEEEKGQEKTSWKDRFRDQRCIDKCEITRSELFGIFSKTTIWKQFAGKHSGLRITVRGCSILKGLQRRNFRESGFSWCEIQDQTWRGWRFWAVRDRGHWKGVCAKRMGPVGKDGWKGGRPGVRVWNPACEPGRNPKITSAYVMISRGKSRFVDELHIPNAEHRSSTELLSELQNV